MVSRLVMTAGKGISDRPLCTTLLLAVLAAVFLSGCQRPTSPDAVALQIRQEIRTGKLEAAQRDAEAALAKYQTDVEWAARFRILEARILIMRGSLSESLQLSEQSLPHSLERTDTEVERKMVQGLAHDYLQQFDAADRAISEAENLGAAIDSSLLGAVAQTRGILEVDRKNFARATAAFRSAAAIGRKRNLPRAELDALANLGYVAMTQEHYDEAVDAFRAALAKSRLIGAADVEAKTLGNLGWNYSAVGDFENAETFLAEAQTKAGQAGLAGDQTYWLNSLAAVYFQQHRYQEARSTARTALELADKQDDKNTLTTCLNTASEIALATGHLDEAERFNLRAAEIENAGLDQFGINRSQLITGQIETGKKHYQPAEASFRKVLADPKAETPLKWEAHARLAEMYAAQGRPAKANHEFEIAIRTFEDARKSVQREEFRVSFLSSAIEFYDAYVNFLIDQKRPLDSLKTADLSRAQSLELGLSSSNNSVSGPDSRTVSRFVAPSNPQDTARQLSATLLFYWLGEKKSWLWAVTPTKTSLFPLPPSAEIDATVRNYRDSFTGPRDQLESGNAEGRKLYATLVQPAEKLIANDSRVVILPDGTLNSLNFETLIVAGSKPEDKAHYWIEDVTIVTANSFALLSPSLFGAPPKDGRLLLIGDALAASPDFPPLPQGGKEVGLLENYFTSSQRLELTGANATATHFLSSEPEKFSYLHFATHGTASRLRPLESAVILSPEGDSFKLYARDVVRHPLSAYLVTISACNGAGTKSYAGEGLVGLSWAFLRAGAHNVIAGLWEVSNASTPQLMDELYKGLRAGEDPATALRKAKLHLVHSTGNYRKPFYWAPFLLYSGS
jgi:CHAT domain-containing protein/Tfp pilus assembly protein PilF